MSRAVREALWAGERAERTAKASAQQVRRPQKPSTGSWSVLRINDAGRRQVVSAGLSYEAAERQAGRRRDRSSDAEVGEGWNHLPKRQAHIAGGEKAMRPSTRYGGQQQGEGGFPARSPVAVTRATAERGAQGTPGVRHSRGWDRNP